MPVAAHEAVREMHASDRLHLIKGHDLTDHAAVHDAFKLLEEGRIAQNVADDDGNAVCLCRVRNVGALLYGLCNGLFEQQMIAQRDRLHRGLVVHAVRGRNDCDIRHFREREKLAEVGKTHFLGDVEHLSDHAALFLDQVGNGKETTDKLAGILAAKHII